MRQPFVGTYHKAMAVEQLLPYEADDMTATPLHAWILYRLFGAVCTVFHGTALVLQDVFLRVGGDTVTTGVQVAPDLLVVPGVEWRTDRRVYRVPEEPVPAATVEILSSENYLGGGRAALERKRDLLGRIGVPTHIEIDPELGTLTVWENHGDRLVLTGEPTDRYDGPVLGGLRIELVPGEIRLWMPNGEDYLDGAGQAESALQAERARADAQQTRADRYLELLRNLGVDPDHAD